MEQGNLSDKELEELLKIASSTPSSKARKTTSVDTFISKFQIKSGTSKIPNHIIYYKYCMWKKTNRESKNWFFRSFSSNFESGRGPNGRYYLLDPEPFDLSMEYHFKARAFLRKQRSAKKEKKV